MEQKNMKDLSEARKQKRPEKKGKANNSKLFLFVLMLLVGLLLVGQLTVLTVNNDNATDVIMSGQVNNFVSTEGCFIRDEVVINSNEGGYLAPSVPAGEKVAAYEVVAQSYDESSSLMLSQLQEAEKKLNDEIRKTFLPASYRSFDIKKINQVIEERLKRLMAANSVDSFEPALGIEREIRTLTNEKVDHVLKSIPANSILKVMEQDVENLRQQFNASSGAVKASYSGIASFYVDGYEDELKPKKLSSVKPELIEKVIKEKNTQSKNKMNSMKIIRGFDAYIASIVSKDFGDSLELNSNSLIRLNDVFLEINGLLVQKKPYKNNKMMVVFKIDRGLEATSEMRSVNIEILKSSQQTSGLRVPITSLLNFDNTKGTAKVVIVRNHKAIMRGVKILDYDEAFAIIEDEEITEREAVKLYDEYLKQPEGVEEGQLVR